MKTILVPIDFSECSRNSALYAMELAKLMKAKILLFHAYHLPIYNEDNPKILFTETEIQESSNFQLDRLKLELREGSPENKTVPIDCLSTAGNPVEEIRFQADTRKADLLVMGVPEESKIRRTFFGSVTTTVLKRTKRPIIIVPQKATFKPLKKIAFAYDYLEAIGKSTMDELKLFLKLFNANLYVINVERPQERFTVQKAYSRGHLEQELTEVDHSLVFPSNEDIVSGILDFDDRHQVDMLVMIPRRHNFLHKILHSSKTEKVAFMSHIPLLALHEAG